MKYAEVIFRAREDARLKGIFSLEVPWQSPLIKGFFHKNSKCAITVYDKLHPALCRGAVYMKGTSGPDFDPSIWTPIEHELRSMNEYIVEAIMSIQLWDEAFDFKLHKEGRDSEREKEEKKFTVIINGTEWTMTGKKEIRSFCNFLEA